MLEGIFPTVSMNEGQSYVLVSFYARVPCKLVRSNVYPFRLVIFNRKVTWRYNWHVVIFLLVVIDEELVRIFSIMNASFSL